MNYEMELKKSILDIIFTLLICILLSGCSNERNCPGCDGMGGFPDDSGWIVCRICNGDKKISSEYYESLTSQPTVNTEPAKVVKYCNICNGTGRFHAPRSVMESECHFCHGTGIADDDRYNTTAALYECIDCGGTGKNQWDGTNCYSCNGTGLSRMSVEDQINSNPPTARGNLCGACGGTTVCPVCHGHAGHRYGDIQYCSSCGNTGKCKWCYGRGF